MPRAGGGWHSQAVAGTKVVLPRACYPLKAGEARVFALLTP